MCKSIHQESIIRINSVLGDGQQRRSSREAQDLVCCAKRLALCSPCDRGMSKGADMCGFGLEGSLWLQSEGIGLGMG